jgi:hypothetical protein
MIIRNLQRSRTANVLAEAPITLWFLFIGLALPLLILATLTYRIVMLDYAVRDSCARAARADSYSEAREIASNTFKGDLAAFTGVKGSESIYIIVKPLDGSPPQDEPEGLTLGSVDTINNVYLLKTVAKAEVAPLFTMGSNWMGAKVPGLTSSYPLTVSAQSYVEDPDVLTK